MLVAHKVLEAGKCKEKHLVNALLGNIWSMKWSIREKKNGCGVNYFPSQRRKSFLNWRLSKEDSYENFDCGTILILLAKIGPHLSKSIDLLAYAYFKNPLKFSWCVPSETHKAHWRLPEQILDVGTCPQRNLKALAIDKYRSAREGSGERTSRSLMEKIDEKIELA